MKKLLSVLSFVLLANFLLAQTPARKYVLIEHFTNSKCINCANRNPAFYNLISQAQYADDIHHISIHPPIPYNSCVLYLTNTSENIAWSNWYGVQGTPQIAINGTLLNGSIPLLSAATLETYLNQTSPVSVVVTEAGPANARTVNIKVKTHDAVPAGNYKLYVALAEKVVNLTPPASSQPVHHDVFRKLLPDTSGIVFVPAAIGQTAEFNFQYAVAPGWNANEVFATAFVRNTATKAVLNSGTRFDAVVSGTGDLAAQTVRILPNPIGEFAYASIGGDRAQSVEVFAANGQRVSLSFENQGEMLSLPTASLAPGIYFLKIIGEKGLYTGKFVKN